MLDAMIVCFDIDKALEKNISEVGTLDQEAFEDFGWGMGRAVRFKDVAYRACKILA